METLYKQFKIFEEIVNFYCAEEKKLDLTDDVEFAPVTLSALLCFIENNNVENIKFNSKVKKIT